LAPAEAAAQHTLQFLFNPERAARLVEFHARDAANPSLEEVLDAILAATWKAPEAAEYSAEIARVVDNVALYDLMALAANEKASGQVRAVASLKLEELKSWLNAQAGDSAEQHAHRFFAAARIATFQKDPKQSDFTVPSEPPDGPPIGGADEDF
jgi:hypothetical protein